MKFFYYISDKIYKTIKVIFAQFEWSGYEANILESNSVNFPEQNLLKFKKNF